MNLDKLREKLVKIEIDLLEKNQMPSKMLDVYVSGCQLVIMMNANLRHQNVKYSFYLLRVQKLWPILKFVISSIYFSYDP